MLELPALFGFALATLLILPALDTETVQGEDHEGAHEGRKPNKLLGSTSPYLLQHLYNPVDWNPWGEEALQRAKDENKPIFLSVGYSACHWCHVMERESFESADIAKLMNEHFVCIKVDREERPDIDEIYMAAVQQMTGSGGWPMSVFLTPELEPFFGGTYFPPKSRGGMPGFDDVLNRVHQIWTDNPEWAKQAGKRMIDALEASTRSPAAAEMPGRELLETALQHSGETFDPQYGGFGGAPHYAPKFPHCTELTYLLRLSSLKGHERAAEMAEVTLDNMARGGIYDQVGGGFARYTTDRSWTVPHFEKMLYDNSQLAMVYLEAWQGLGDAFYRDISEEILAYVQREMTGPEGGFYSTTDADSEGHEGKFFVWSLAEFNEVCGEDAELARAWFGVTQRGNFEGQNILTAHQTLEQVATRLKTSAEEVRAAVERCREKLYERRKGRVHPLLDDKIITAWNGLMLSAFARAAAVYGHEGYLTTARGCASFLLTKMRKEDGSLYRTRREGTSHLVALLEDYAFVVQGLLDLYEADGDARWLKAALELHAYTEEHFADDQRGGYWSFPDGHDELPVRMASATESSLPSDIGVACMNAARIGLLTGDPELVQNARDGVARHLSMMQRWPTGFCQLLLVLDFLTSDPVEVYVVGEAGDKRVEEELGRLRRQWPPYRVFTGVEPEHASKLEALLPPAQGKTALDGEPTVYLCREGACKAPRKLE